LEAKAIEKAEEALAHCTDCLEEIKSATVVRSNGFSRNFKTIDSAWTRFLQNANRFYAKLEQGSKNTPKSKNWFAERKLERKKDELLQFLHQAHHADEHSLQESVLEAGGAVHLPPSGSATFMKLPDTNNARGRFMVQAGEKGATLSFPNKFAKRIKNRGVTYSVPTKHLETTIEDTSAENFWALSRHLPQCRTANGVSAGFRSDMQLTPRGGMVLEGW